MRFSSRGVRVSSDGKQSRVCQVTSEGYWSTPYISGLKNRSCPVFCSRRRTRCFLRNMRKKTEGSAEFSFANTAFTKESSKETKECSAFAEESLEETEECATFTKESSEDSQDNEPCAKESSEETEENTAFSRSYSDVDRHHNRGPVLITAFRKKAAAIGHNLRTTIPTTYGCRGSS